MERLCRVLRWPVVLPVLLGVSLLLTIGSYSTVEADVRRDTQAVLAAGGYEGVSIESVSYRAVVLEGPSEVAEETLAAVGELRSTREVEFIAVDGTTPGADPVVDPAADQASIDSAASPIDLRGTVDAGSLTLAGTVPDIATRSAIVAAATGAFGDTNVSDAAVEVDDASATTDPRTDAEPFIAALQAVAPYLVSGEISQSGDALTVTGIAESAAAVNAIEAALAAVGTVDVVAQQSSLDLTGAISAGEIELSGVVPDEGARLEIVDATNAAFGPANVSATIDTATGAPSQSDLRAVDDVVAILQAMAEALGEGMFDVAGGELSVTGTAAGSEELATLQDVLDQLTALVPTAAVTIPPGSEAMQSIVELLASTSITFEPGSEVLTEQGAAVVDQVADLLLEAFAREPGLELLIAGHTDDQGQADANLILSLAQASTVRTALIERGLPGGSLTAVGFGETQPVTSNDSPEGREQNRRIEFTVLEG